MWGLNSKENAELQHLRDNRAATAARNDRLSQNLEQLATGRARRSARGQTPRARAQRAEPPEGEASYGLRITGLTSNSGGAGPLTSWGWKEERRGKAFGQLMLSLTREKGIANAESAANKTGSATASPRVHSSAACEPEAMLQRPPF